MSDPRKALGLEVEPDVQGPYRTHAEDAPDPDRYPPGHHHQTEAEHLHYEALAEDAPRPDNASQGSTVSGGERPEQAEDAPEGPTKKEVWRELQSIDRALDPTITGDGTTGATRSDGSPHPHISTVGRVRLLLQKYGYVKRELNRLKGDKK